MGSIRPRLSMSDAISRLYENKKATVTDVAESSSMSAPSETQEDVVIIEEEEMILVRKESPVSSPVRETVPPAEEASDAPVVPPVEEALVVNEVPEPQCIEAEITVSVPPAKSKPKKKQQKRR